MPDKQHILDEIRRTAEANGGRPLGQERFASETGIRICDWQGKYWARWSEALSEAGYAPNEFNKRVPSEQLLQHYAEFARELGRLPGNADMRLKARNGCFPGRTIAARFAKKRDLVCELQSFCRSNSGYDDVLQMCEQYVYPRKAAAQDDEAKADHGSIGFVYLLKSGRNYKIGHSNSVGRRQYELKIQLPEATDLVHEIRTDDPAGIEAYWHKRFEAKRKNGEWFELNAADVAVFKRRKFM